MASHVHKSGSIHWDNINLAGEYDWIKAYNQSKLANVMHSLALARRLEPSGVTACSLTPGNVATEITRSVTDVPCFTCANFFFSYVAKTPFEGAQTTIYCALAEDLGTGKYFNDCKEDRVGEAALSVQDQERLWALSEKLVGLRQTV